MSSTGPSHCISRLARDAKPFRLAVPTLHPLVPPPAAPEKRRCLEPSPRDPDTRTTKIYFIKPRVWSDYQSFRYAATAPPYCRGTHGSESRNSGYMIPPKRVVVLVPLPVVAGVASSPFCLTLLLPPSLTPLPSFSGFRLLYLAISPSASPSLSYITPSQAYHFPPWSIPVER